MMPDLNVSLEISMYPLQDEFLPSIDAFLLRLHNIDGLKVKTNVMSTQVFGPLDLVFDSVKKAIHEVYSTKKQCPFVIKVLNDDASDMEIKGYK